MIRLIQIVLLFAIIIPFGMAVRWGVLQLPDAAVWFGAGIPAGMAISMLLDKWDRSIRQREGARRGD